MQRSFLRMCSTYLLSATLPLAGACSSDEDDHSDHDHDLDTGGAGGSGGATGGSSASGGSSDGGSSTGGGGSGGMSMGGTGGMNMGGMGGEMNMDCGTGADMYMAGMEKEGESGNFTVVLVESDPEPAEQGDQTWTIRVEDTSGDPVSGATVDPLPFMPAMDHGTPKDAAVTDNGDGTYTLMPVNLFMGGLWEVTIDIAAGGVTDTVMFSFCVGGGMNMDMDGGMGGMNMGGTGGMNMDGGMSMDGG